MDTTQFFNDLTARVKNAVVPNIASRSIVSCVGNGVRRGYSIVGSTGEIKMQRYAVFVFVINADDPMVIFQDYGIRHQIPSEKQSRIMDPTDTDKIARTIATFLLTGQMPE